MVKLKKLVKLVYLLKFIVIIADLVHNLLAWVTQPFLVSAASILLQTVSNENSTFEEPIRMIHLSQILGIQMKKHDILKKLI